MEMATTDTQNAEQISCVSLGMVILDEIRMPDKPALLDVIGGSATFATLGLRLFATESLLPGCLVMAGSDFPPDIRDEISSWQTRLVIKTSPDHKSSRGLLTYTDSTFGPKTFSYTTPPIRPTPNDLMHTPLLGAKAFHFFSTPEDLTTQIPSLLALRRTHYPTLPPPFLVWEPLPSSCTPQNLPLFLAACTLVDVFSPNHLELGAFFAPDTAQRGADLVSQLEAQGQRFLDAGIGAQGAGVLLIRAGAEGALGLRRGESAVHVPAFYGRGAEEVVDATGAGNAFLGGYVAGWLRGAGVRGAMEYGAVAASVAIEQVGLPLSGVVDAEMGMKRLAEFRGGKMWH